MERIIDITVPLTPTLPVWPGDPVVELQRVADLRSGDAYNLSRLTMSVHAGTHVDAPAHFIDRGSGIESVLLTTLCGACVVWDVPGDGAVTPSDLQGLPEGVERVLLRTGVGRWWRLAEPRMPDEHRGLSQAASAWLIERGVKLVGVDVPSIDAPEDERFPAHHTLLTAGVVIVENLDLWDVAAGPYYLICLPLLLFGADGAPARAILVEK